MDGAVASLIAVITGLAAIVSAVGGVLLAIRAVRNRERTESTKERRGLEDTLAEERTERVQIELQNHQLKVLLARHGIDPEHPDNQGD